jgi:hypothetical protein
MTAIRKGHTYGTILVDLERHQVIFCGWKPETWQIGSQNIQASK